MDLAQAKKKIMDYVATRDHSEKELRQKMELHYESEVIDKALIWAKSQNWLATSEDLTLKISAQLHQRGQGIQVINQKLEAKGLPQIQSTPDLEFSKARHLVLAKWTKYAFNDLSKAETQKLKAKIMRFLLSRGYELEIVEQLIKNEYNAGALSHEDE